ncbi:MAG: serine--tRNA ligase [Candidatus Komeilibacteria bacterium CG10_big_fil_rev_8_21_14_0_10_41_13]|uniref:Serine--tRNA ligase n=1 Tax=Candidatus Komeilibacteria bacterium CG10_big_fil_rev_8_21_14_0_10_41_13 TaxID=1974476 RepID=A0A2M6WBK1_9BACT|nr:MAG: serine--tRNA ligase [Candidatus Komeilibacteria bacterium CG10_big_fil_rev_8_21_14_0_10_41_13]
MLDINKIRDNKAEIERALLKRVKKDDLKLDQILALDEKRKELIPEVENLQAERNKFSKTKPDQEIIKKMKEVGEKIKQLEEKRDKVESDLRELLSALPNIPAEDVPAGGKENNQVIRTFGRKPNFGFEAKDHVNLATSLKLIDYERAAKMSGSGFWAYTGKGALLEWALLNYFIDFHRKNGYQFLIPPYLLNEDSAFVSGHLPKFKDDLYWTQDKTCLNATSEMMLGNFHRDEILEDLPKKYFAFSTCFRREAGSYRTEERGMIRGHQFNKIEMFIFSKPEESWQAFEELNKYAEKLVEGLDLHYQTSLLAAGDASAAMSKTVDIEVWIPSMNCYKEVSSVSNALDYQARRGNVRYKNKETGRNEFVHTLNASGLATSRLIPAILEQFQNQDGSVKVPKALQKFLGEKILK